MWKKPKYAESANPQKNRTNSDKKSVNFVGSTRFSEKKWFIRKLRQISTRPQLIPVRLDHVILDSADLPSHALKPYRS